MKVYIIVQENQNDHGFVDTTVLDAYTDEQMARTRAAALEDEALKDGERVAGRDDEPADWTVSFYVQEVTLYRAPITSIESQVYIETGETPVVKGVR